jgi:hypothetical protein
MHGGIILLVALLSSSGTRIQEPSGVGGSVSTEGTPVRHAVVTLICGAAERVTTTTDDGRYWFQSRPAGECRVSVDAVGFEPQTKKLPTSDTHLSFTLTHALSLNAPTPQSLALTHSTKLMAPRGSMAGGITFSSKFSDSARPGAGTIDRRRWEYQTGVSFTTGRQQFGGDVRVSHGQSLFQHMREPLHGTLLNFPMTSHVDVTGSQQLAATIFLKRRLFESESGRTIDGVVQATLPLSCNSSRTIPWTLQPMRSSALSVGVVITY